MFDRAGFMRGEGMFIGLGHTERGVVTDGGVRFRRRWQL